MDAAVMTKGAALNSFFSRFLPAYPENNVPDGVELPYLTYEPIFDSFDVNNAMAVKLWFYTSSEAIPNAKAQEISDAIGRGGAILPCDGGAVWIKRDSPFCQSIENESDINLKGRQIGLSIEYFTEN